MVIIAIIGILAAIAIPQFQQYRNRADSVAVKSELTTIMQLEQDYYTDFKTYTTDLVALGYLSKSVNIDVAVTYADENCFQAEGSGENPEIVINMDCSGFTD